MKLFNIKHCVADILKKKMVVERKQLYENNNNVNGK